MPLVRVQDRIADIVAATLTDIMGVDDEVQYEVWMSDHYESHEDDECPGHFIGEMVNIFISLAIGVDETGQVCRSDTNWAVPNSLCYDAQYVDGKVREQWDRILMLRDTVLPEHDLDDELKTLVEKPRQ